MDMPIYLDRREAGRALSKKLAAYAGRADVLILALPRGGVPVAFELAQALRAPLDVFVVRKLGVPGHEELAMGAIAGGGVRVINDDVVRMLNIAPQVIEAIAAQEEQELERRSAVYRGHRPPLQLHDRTVILVDDGLATGASMRAAVLAVRAQGPRRVVVAAPVAEEGICREFERLVDDMVCGATPEPFVGVGRWYVDFSQTSDDEVRALLAGTPAEERLNDEQVKM